MERMKPPPLPEQPDPSLRVDVFRHGKAKYEQTEVTPAEARDLTEEGALEVERQAEALAELIGPEEEVEIWSSPMGRTLHTAKIIAETLKRKGIHLRQSRGEDASGLKVFDQLSEARNFSWRLFQPLMDGGDVEFAGQRFTVDRELTNPRHLGYPEYYTKDGIGGLSPEAKALLPEAYVKEVEGMEKFMEATRRIMKPLERLKDVHDKPYRVVIVTHDALTGFIVNVFTGGERSGLNPGEFINIERRDGKLVATGIGTSEENGERADILEEFGKRQ